MKVLVVDDSIVYRMAITKALETESGVEVVGGVSNGALAIEELKKNSSIDVITLDMEMPVMDGITTIKEIRAFNKKVRIVVFSSITVKGAEKTIEALNLGADDFVTKEEVGGAKSIDGALEMIKKNLLPKLKSFERFTKPVETSSAPLKQRVQLSATPKLIVIGSSTGGPEALSCLMKSLKSTPAAPILLVQHMPPIFTNKLAEMLNSLTPHVEVVEAQKGMKVEVGKVYIAPGDYHMTLTPDFSIDLNQKEKNCFVRPSVNELLYSVADNFQDKVLTIILTGMGEDGGDGVDKVKHKSEVIIQDEATSVVWGMPSAVKRIIPDVTEVPITEFGNIISG